MRKVFSEKKFFYVGVPIFIIIMALLTNCERSSISPDRLEKIIVMQSSVSPGDPHICSDSANRLSIIFTVYEALVKLDNEGTYQPSLAESWYVAEDSRTWTFKLRRGVKFHNGDILNAEDVVATLGRVLDPAIGGAFGTQGVYISYLGAAEISAIDAQKVRIVTEDPMADLLDLLVAMPISPKSELDKLPHEYVGSGPYKVAEQTNSKTILEAHDEYWGKAPTYREIHWIAERSSAKRVTSLLSGQADVISGIRLQDAEQIKGNGEATVYELESGLCIIFMCNAQKGPCKDRRVRQALNYALDLDKLIGEIKHGAATPLNGYLTPHHFGYNPETPVYPYDPEKARTLLAEAGYGDGLELAFDIPSVMPDEAPPLAQFMVEQFKKVGISLDVFEHEDRAAYSEMVRDKNIKDACCFDSSPRSTYRVLREKIQSTLQGPWWQGYENKKVNDLIKKAEATFNDRERQKIYRQIYTIIRDDAPWIFLYRPTRYWGVRSSMKDWKLRSDGLLIFN
ncbi:MAG: ABC transporter substrate-binding protein [Candidatus Aminicenantes bacterium]|nr:MAG: ABC transporter substrate-binding protein [Candidatus Aminicenantes bacterium]